MPKRTDIKKILVIGAGPIVIGQACEFDYSGTQACKALREEGYEVVLLNSNPATIMTDTEFSNKTYVEPDWIQSAPMPDPLGGDPMEINRYFHRNPSMVLGTLERSGSMRYGADVTVRPDPGVDLEAALTAIAGRLPAGVMTPSWRAGAPKPVSMRIVREPSRMRNVPKLNGTGVSGSVMPSSVIQRSGSMP